MSEIMLRMTIVAGAWGKLGAGSERLWNGPPRGDMTNTAARTEPSWKWWPFSRWTWSIFSPFEDDAIEDGVANSEMAARAMADAALTSYVIEAERRLVTPKGSATWADASSAASPAPPDVPDTPPGTPIGNG